ncbi:ribonuclease HII [candidate division KSB1 bacterium]|nr:ribonuclease HII [candidate division KSB1 bacterium]
MNSTSVQNQDEARRIQRMQRFEHRLWRSGIQYIAGVDEAGRGPLAGPVVAAAVIFAKDSFIPYINDSKKLTAIRRERLFDQIQDEAVCISVGLVTSKEIDQINILRATHRAMKKAVESLDYPPEFVLIDGTLAPQFSRPSRAIVGGDRKSYSIAAASIIAKVTRDRMMADYNATYPRYDFAKNKGYGTRKHVEALREYGPCPIHRTSFQVLGWQ